MQSWRSNTLLIILWLFKSCISSICWQHDLKGLYKPLKTAAEQRHFSTVQYWFLPLTHLFAKTAFNILWSLSEYISHLNSHALSFDTIDKPVVFSLVTWFDSKSKSATKSLHPGPLLSASKKCWVRNEWRWAGVGTPVTRLVHQAQSVPPKKCTWYTAGTADYFCLQTRGPKERETSVNSKH